MERKIIKKTIFVFLLALNIFSVFDIGYCNDGPLIYEMDFTDNTFYKYSRSGARNEFYMYLPANTPQPGVHDEFTALGYKNSYYINSLSDLRTRNYPIKIWYEV